MSEPRKENRTSAEPRKGRWLFWIVAGMAILPLLAALYAGAYLGLGEWHETALTHCRAYRTTTEVRLFQPAAAVESWLTGRQVACWVHDPNGGIRQP